MQFTLESNVTIQTGIQWCNSDWNIMTKVRLECNCAITKHEPSRTNRAELKPVFQLLKGHIYLKLSSLRVKSGYMPSNALWRHSEFQGEIVIHTVMVIWNVCFLCQTSVLFFVTICVWESMSIWITGYYFSINYTRSNKNIGHMMQDDNVPFWFHCSNTFLAHVDLVVSGNRINTKIIGHPAWVGRQWYTTPI